jgi:catechol 2,3-dioxygenase
MTWRYPGALFLGAGGYHHHVGTNTWAGAGARPPAADDAQLLAWTLVLPDAAEVDAVAASLTAQGAPVAWAGRNDLLARDPWGTAVRVVAGGA